MSPSKLGIFASLALATSAVLLPPTTHAHLGDDDALETLAINPFKRSVALECPGCASATLESDSLKWTEGTGNNFLLDFEVGAGEDTLTIDGNKLYPPSFSYHAPPKFYVTQVHPNAQASDAQNIRLAVTGYSLHFSSAETVSEAGTELLPLKFRILAIESMPVAPPALTINLLKDAHGRLMIASFQTEQANGVSTANEEKECRQWPLLCKWRGFLADRIEQLKSMDNGRPGRIGCHKRPHGQDHGHGHGHGNPMAEEGTEGKPPHRFRPGHPHHHPHHRPHHMDHDGHRHHHPHHRMHMFLYRAFSLVLLPVVVGIFAGTLTYMIGMALGCFIAIVIARFRGQNYQRIALEDDVEEGEYYDEKEMVAELPAYDCPPVYEEKVEIEVEKESK